MRTDTRIDRYPVKCFQASTLGYGKYIAEVGDIIIYRESTYNVEDLKTLSNPHVHERIGRMAGRVHYAPALGETPEIKNHILVVCLSLDSPCAYERWIAPEDVLRIYDPNHADRKILELITFFFSPEFRHYNPDQLRQWAYSGYATPALAGFAPSKTTGLPVRKD